MSFAQPIWIGVGIVFCFLLALFFWKMEQVRQKKLHAFAAPHLLGKYTVSISQSKRSIKKVLYIGAVFCCFLALARPQYSFKWVEVKRQGIDIMFALDTSKSMLAEDIKPNRLNRAKFAILDFVQKLEGDRIGLLPFAGSTFLLCPLTVDYDAFSQSLSAVNTNIIPHGGTNIGDTIRQAEKILSTSSNHKILVLLSDGENLEGDALVAAQEVTEKGMTIFTVGVGTSGGELIPYTINGKTGFVKDKAGNFVTSKLDEQALRQIAEQTGGIYVPLGTSGEGLEKIYQQKLSIIPKEELAERKQKVPLERFEWPLALALCLLLVEYLTNTRTNSKAHYFEKIKTAGRRIRKSKLPSLLLLMTFTMLPPQINASEGEDAYATGNYIKSSKYYSKLLEKDANNPKLQFNYGAAAYKNNLYDQATEAFTKALSSDDPSLQQLAYYNKGNALYQKGNLSIQSDSQKTIKQWEKSIEAYQGSLALNPDNENAKNNLDLVTKKLELLEKQEKEKQEQQDQNQDNSENSDESEDSDKNQEQGKESDKQDQNSDKNKNQPQPSEDKQNSDNKDDPQQEEQAGDEGREDDKPKENSTKAEETDKDEDDKQAQQASEQQGQPGQMSEDDARRLLNSLMDEEGNLNFVPQGQHDTQQPAKDW